MAHYRLGLEKSWLVVVLVHIADKLSIRDKHAVPGQTLERVS